MNWVGVRYILVFFLLSTHQSSGSWKQFLEIHLFLVMSISWVVSKTTPIVLKILKQVQLGYVIWSPFFAFFDGNDFWYQFYNLALFCYFKSFSLASWKTIFKIVKATCNWTNWTCWKNLLSLSLKYEVRRYQSEFTN